MLILHLNFNSLLPKIDEICFIAKQSNVSVIGISEPKLDSSLFNNEVDIENYDQLEWIVQGGEAELHVILQNHYLTIVSQINVLTRKVFL